MSEHVDNTRTNLHTDSTNAKEVRAGIPKDQVIDKTEMAKTNFHFCANPMSLNLGEKKKNVLLIHQQDWKNLGGEPMPLSMMIGFQEGCC